ncbi:gamma-glutamyltransferase [Novosphingobium sp. RD2P27]|uniref:Glutathione hydrolase proenzyme n=1 Tax=Novosphingobium kalidii TaxID=3230299 RepID=A0ABV2CXF5_9SPHN
MALKIFPAHLLALASALVLPACATAPPVGPSPTAAARENDVYDKGMVSAADPRAAEAGAEMLRRGGSATDAAIATMLALTVVEPQSSGIGGGGFYVHSDAAGHLYTIDGRETAPAAATPQRFLDADGKPLLRREAVVSGLSVGVPGNVALAAKAHARDGKLAWAELFQPAIRLARGGYTLSERGRSMLARSPDSGAHDSAARALYYGADGQPHPAGTLIRNPALAATLEALAQQGPQAFYTGPLAQTLAEHVAAETPAEAGKMTLADVTSYEAKQRSAPCGTYRVYTICGMGPPSSGETTVLGILVALENFDLAALGPESPVAWHLFAEAQRLAYADRELYLADPDFVPVPLAGLTNHAYLLERGKAISPGQTLPTVTAGDPPGGDRLSFATGQHYPEHGTSHFVAVDRKGNAVSYTSTIESAFGSGLFVGGFYLNNELTDFSAVPEQNGRLVANRVEGGKRPRSSMAPTLVFGPDGKLLVAVGAAGGATIPVQVARALIGFLDWKLPIQEALALPVLFSPQDTVIVEKGSRLEAMVPALENLGHKVRTAELPLKTNAIAVVNGRLAGAADPRSEGRAVAQ